jgi:hypothetical protein
MATMPGRHRKSLCGTSKDIICRETRKKTFDDKIPMPQTPRLYHR